MSGDALLTKLNVHHLLLNTRAKPGQPSIAVLLEAYDDAGEAVLRAVLNGVSSEIIKKRSERLFRAREALRDRGITPE